jgi:hypothetical protein
MASSSLFPQVEDYADDTEDCFLWRMRSDRGFVLARATTACPE